MHALHPRTGFSFAFAIPGVLSQDLKKKRLAERLMQARPSVSSFDSSHQLELFQARHAMKLERRLTELGSFGKKGISEHMSNL
jgi:hypothetical protein